LVLVLDSLGRKPFLGSMLHDLLEVVWVYGVEDVKEVGSTWSFVLWVGILEVNLEVSILLQFGPEVLHGKFLEVGDMNVVDLLLLHEPLFVGEDLSEEVLVHLGGWWEIVLY
jgi:hypothetical protein